MWSHGLILLLLNPPYFRLHRCHTSTGCLLVDWPFLGRRLAQPGNVELQVGVLLLGTLSGSYMESYPEVSNPNMLVYKFRTYNMILIQNEHVKIDETYIDTQGRFKENHSSVMDVLGRLASKLL